MKKLQIILLLLLFSCINLSIVYAGIPTITSLIGPTERNCRAPSGSYGFSATVKGGSPPYTYKWAGSNQVIAEGTQYDHITLDESKIGYLHYNGEYYWIQLWVTDAEGQAAAWKDPASGISKQEFDYAFACVDSKGKLYPSTLTSSYITIPQLPYEQFESKEKPVEKKEIKPQNQTNCAETTTDSQATFSHVSGSVKIGPGNEGCWKFAKLRARINIGDHIKTEEDSNAQIVFVDLSDLKIGPESEIVIEATEKKSNLELVTGKIMVNFKKIINGGSLEVGTHYGVTGVKGTTFVLSDDGKTSTLKVINGTVEFTSKADNKLTLVTAGEMITADKSGSHPKQTFNIAEETQTWEKLSNAPSNSSLLIIAVIVVIILLIIGYFKFVKK